MSRKNVSRGVLETTKKFINSFIWSIWVRNLDLKKVARSYLEAYVMLCWRRLLRIPWTEGVPNDEDLRDVDEKRMLIGSIVERRRRSNIVVRLQRRSKWFTTLVGGEGPDWSTWIGLKKEEGMW